MSKDTLTRELSFALQTTVWGREDILRAHGEGLFADGEFAEPPVTFFVTGGRAVPVTDPWWLMNHLFYMETFPLQEAKRLLEQAHREQPFAVRHNLQRMLQVAEHDETYASGLDLKPDLYEFIKQLAAK